MTTTYEPVADTLFHPEEVERQTVGGTVRVAHVSLGLSDGTLLLDDVSFVARPGELVAIVGASGAGKSTLLDVLGGNVAPCRGTVVLDGVTTQSLTAAERRRVGYVSQHEVLSEDLPLRRMLDYAAQLRLPAGTSRARREELIDRALAQVELTPFAHTTTKDLSGGQRRRASIAMELVTDPDVCFLDEPTSGLDPSMAEAVVGQLRSLADSGRTVIFVTHNARDLRWCDRIVSLAPGGLVTFDGSPADAMDVAGATDVEVVHRALTARVHRAPAPAPVVEAAPRRPDDHGPSRFRVWAALTKRTLENVVRNKLTLAIMVGSPAMVIAMFAVLFQPGAFDPAQPSPTATIMIGFWIAFGGFFFGLTYGLLQIVPEVPLMRREHRAGVGAGAQVLAKLAALTPILIAIDLVMLGVLSWLDRLPALSVGTFTTLAVTLALDAIAALALGLLASALVRTPSQASLALPMLCFPAVLFSGAILAVPTMAPVGRAISAAMPDRWAFESIGADLGLRELFAADPTALGPALLREYGDTWTISHTGAWLTLAGFTVVLSLATWAALARRCRTDERPRK